MRPIHAAMRGYSDVIQTSINFGLDISVIDEVTLDITQYFLECHNLKQHILGQSIRSYIVINTNR